MSDAAESLGEGLPVVPEIQLTREQESAVERLCDWGGVISGKKTMSLGGYAGTGKTTVIKAVADTLKKTRSVAIAAFTGKAVSNLRKKGVPSAVTLHSLLYNCTQGPDGKLLFVKRRELEVGIVVVDEASMVSKSLNEDLLSFPVKVLYVGDPGQLEPVGEDINLMRETDILLTEIHRQAAGSNIIKFASAVRKGKTFGYGAIPDLTIATLERFWRECPDYDQIICGYNNTRHELNRNIRADRGYKGTLPQKGERVICLRNNKDLGVFNGMQGIVLEAGEDTGYLARMSIETETGERRFHLPVLTAQFGKDKAEEAHIPRTMCLFDYAYAITCHKAQGSEWDKVAVLEQVHPDWDPARWRYTAATRASKTLLYCK